MTAALMRPKSAWVSKGYSFWPDDAVDLEPKKIQQLYENKFCGCWFDDVAAGEVAAAIEASDGYGDTIAHKYGFADIGKGKLSLLFPYVEQLFPGCYPGPAQARGDCFVAGTRVRMADGSERPIEQVSVGEEVISHNGIARRVVRTIQKPYSGPLSVLTVEGYAHPVKATPDHRFVVYKSLGLDGERDWSPVGTLRVGDFVSLPRVAANERLTVFDLADLPGIFTDAGESGRCLSPSDGKVRCRSSFSECNRYVALDERLAWLLGLFLAEGSTDKNENGEAKRLTFNLHRDETVIAEQAATYIQDIFGVTATHVRLPSKPSVLMVRIGCRPLAQFFASLVAGNTYTKRVPWQIFSASRSVRLAMLRGWMDGDGHLDLGVRTKGASRWHRCKLTGVSVSHELCRGMFDLANSCGLRPTLTRRKPHKQSKAASDLHLYGEQALAVYPDRRTDCRTVRMQNVHKQITLHGLAAKVKSVTTEHFTGEVYCLEVEGDHSFIAEGYAVHNCVSHGQKNANLLTLAAEIASAAPDEVTGIVEGPPEVSAEGIKQGVLSTEAIYWMRGYNGDGWQCGTSAKVSTETMALWPRKEYPELGIDLTRYSGSLAGKYGSRKPPQEIIAAGQKHLIRKFTSLRSMEEVRDFIAAGFGINHCGSEGWSSSRDANGFSVRRGSWAHAMSAMGVDDRPIVHEKYGDMLVLIMNSWARWNSGGRRILGTNIDIPEGAFWAKARDCARRSFYAMAGASGWPAKKLPPLTLLPLG